MELLHIFLVAFGVVGVVLLAEYFIDKKVDEKDEAVPLPEPVTPKKPRRARTQKGKFKADDPSTPDVNEAWEGGKAPKPKKKKKTTTRKKKTTKSTKTK